MLKVHCPYASILPVLYDVLDLIVAVAGVARSEWCACGTSMELILGSTGLLDAAAADLQAGCV